MTFTNSLKALGSSLKINKGNMNTALVSLANTNTDMFAVVTRKMLITEARRPLACISDIPVIKPLLPVVAPVVIEEVKRSNEEAQKEADAIHAEICEKMIVWADEEEVRKPVKRKATKKKSEALSVFDKAVAKKATKKKAPAKKKAPKALKNPQIVMIEKIKAELAMTEEDSQLICDL